MEKLIDGKVREVYKVSDDRLVIVTTDRISAFDVVLPKTVPGKGRVLNAISLFWFGFTKDIAENHIISGRSEDMPDYFRHEAFEGRTVLVKRLNILPFEFIVRGYMFGNMWESYRKTRSFCGVDLPGEYRLAEKLEKPVFTPSTKARTGHDEYLPLEAVECEIGAELTRLIQKTCFELYHMCYNYAYSKGIIIADTKFEFGLDSENRLILADEIFTPDSSRFWSLDSYQTGVSPKSYDKQFVRDWLSGNRINGEMQFGGVPDSVLAKTSDIYHECLRRLLHD